VHKGEGQAQELRGAKWRKSHVLLVLIQDPATNVTDTEDIVGDACGTRVMCVSACVRVCVRVLVSVCVTFCDVALTIGDLPPGSLT